MSDYTANYALIKPKKSENYDIDDVTRKNMDTIDTQLFNKVDKIPGKGLSSCDFTEQYKTKLDGLNNYDDTDIKNSISSLKNKQKEQDTTIDDINNDINLANRNLANVIQLAMTNQKNIDTEHETNTQQDKDIADLKTENEELKAENERLRQDMNAYPSNEASGEYITLNDSADSRFNKFKVLGKSTQATRSGKNMVHVTTPTATTNGITFTNNEDGSVTINGTATANAYFNVNIFSGDVSSYFTCTKNEYYGLYIGKSAEGLNFVVRSKTKNYPLLQTDYNTIERVQQYTDETDEECYAYLAVQSGTTINNLTVYPMIVHGTEIGDYEVYGAMPSPKFPSEIINVTGSINLFDGELEEGHIDAITGENSNANDRIRSKNYIEIPINTSKICVIRTIANGLFGLRFYDENKNFLSYIASNENYNTATILIFDIVANAKYIRFIDITNNLESKIKITTELCDYKYSEYGKGIIYIKNTCKNLINQEDIGNYNLYAKKLSHNEDGSIRTTSNFSHSRDIGTFLKLKKNTQYTVSVEIVSITTTGNTQCVLEIRGHHPYTDNNVFGTTVGSVQQIKSEWIGKRFSYTFNSGDYDFWTLHISGWYGSGINGVLIYKNVQIEEGSTATDFENGSQEFEFPLEEGQRLREEDYLADDGIHHKRNTVSFNGTENWKYDSTYNRWHIAALVLYNSVVGAGKAELQCNYFKYSNSTQDLNKISDASSSDWYFYIEDKYLDGKTFPEWLQEKNSEGNPLTVEYNIVENKLNEYVEAYTDEQKQVYDELVKTAKTYKTVTNIFSTNEVSPKFEVEYRQDIKALINNVSQTVLNNA